MKDLTKQTIDLYVQKGIPGGSFIHAVMSNNLMEAIGQADSENLRDIHSICQYVYCHCPHECWGSPEKVKIWVKGGGLVERGKEAK
jgi:hypothetical protein